MYKKTGADTGAETRRKHVGLQVSMGGYLLRTTVLALGCRTIVRGEARKSLRISLEDRPTQKGEKNPMFKRWKQTGAIHGGSSKDEYVSRFVPAQKWFTK